MIERCGFKVPDLMTRCWKAQLDVVKNFDRVCKRHNLKWYACCGTLLGAVRHKGFVPWDDDVDICMMRSDYNLFIYYAEKELPYFIETFDDGNINTHALGITRINNTHDANFEPDYLKEHYDFPYPVGIDLYPMDYVSENYDDLIEFYKYILAVCAKYKLTYWNGFNIHGVYDNIDLEEGYRTIEEVTGARIDRKKDILKQLNNIAVQIVTRPKSDKVACMAHMVTGHTNMIFPTSAFKERLEVPFEDTTVYIPSGYDDILKINYGDYMIPNPVSPHDYPYFKDHERMVMDYIINNDYIVPKEYIADVYDEQKVILDQIYGEEYDI